jgi:hypothetical protein
MRLSKRKCSKEGNDGQASKHLGGSKRTGREWNGKERDTMEEGRKDPGG